MSCLCPHRESITEDYDEETRGSYAKGPNIFTIPARYCLVTCIVDTDENTLWHDAYTIYNIGYDEVLVQMTHGPTEDVLDDVADSSIIKAGQKMIFDNVGKFYFVSGLRIYNNSSVRAIVYCTHGSYSTSGLELYPSVSHKAPNNEMKATYSLGVKHIPYQEKKFRGLYEAFWPTDKLNIWEEILAGIKPLIKDYMYEAASAAINGFMKNIQQKLHTLVESFENDIPTTEIYKEIAKELSEFDDYVLCKKYHDYYCMMLLPLFSNFVLLKTAFCELGILNYPEVGFSDKELLPIYRLRSSANEATEYIDNTIEYWITHIYDSANIENLYSDIMNVRSYITIHGGDYINMWVRMLGYSYKRYARNTEVMTFSNFFGKVTPKLIREATAKQTKFPLVSRDIGCGYDPLGSIDVYLWTSKSSPGLRKIGGMRLNFLSFYHIFVMGTETELVEHLDFMGAQITKLQVTGKGAIDSCTFYLSDGRTVLIGTKEIDSEEEIFEREGYHIASIFLSADDISLGGQAANIAVSFEKNKNQNS